MLATLFYFLGISIIFGSHFYMLLTPPMDAKQQIQHAYLNLFAGSLIVLYYVCDTYYQGCHGQVGTFTF